VHIALLRLVKAAQHVHQRTLASSVGADDGQQFVVTNFDADVSQGCNATESQRDVPGLEHWNVSCTSD